MKSRIILVTAIVLVSAALLKMTHVAGYNKRDSEFKEWIKDQEIAALREAREKDRKLKEVTENAIIQKKIDSEYIDSIRDDNNRLQQQAGLLQSRLRDTTADASALKRVASETAKLLAECEAKANKVIGDYKQTERIAVELKNRLSIYEK